MSDQRTGRDSVSALLLQESILDARIWSPLKEALQGGVTVLEASPPVSPMILSDPHWAVHLADWITAESGIRSVNAVVSHGHAAFGALLLAERRMVSDSVIIIDPAIPSIMPTLREPTRSRLYTTLQSEEAQGKLAAMFESIPPEELQALRQAGRLSEASTKRFVEAIVTAAEFDDRALYSLVKGIATERLSRAFSDGIQLRPPSSGTDFPSIASSLSSRLHVALTARSAVGRLDLRSELQEMYPEAEFHDLPGPDGVQGWWRFPGAYAEMIQSALPTPSN